MVLGEGRSGLTCNGFTGYPKVTVNSLAAGCKSFYRKIYEHFYSVQDGHCPL